MVDSIDGKLVISHKHFLRDIFLSVHAFAPAFFLNCAACSTYLVEKSGKVHPLHGRGVRTLALSHAEQRDFAR